MANIISVNSNATHKWGVMVLGNNGQGPQWQTVGFLRTERAALQYALDMGAAIFLVARRYEAREGSKKLNNKRG